ncbi:hypothetical protein Btru_069385 [Bulinus truncatus]|nr:hypothetical protein Btru_069385 [Bulinus truncatus]
MTTRTSHSDHAATENEMKPLNHEPDGVVIDTGEMTGNGEVSIEGDMTLDREVSLDGDIKLDCEAKSQGCLTCTDGAGINKKPTPAKGVGGEEEEPKSLFGFVLEKLGPRSKKVLAVTSLLLYVTFFITAILLSTLGTCYDEQDVLPLVYLTVTVSLFLVTVYAKDKVIGWLRQRVAAPVEKFVKKHLTIFQWLLILLLALSVLAVILVSAVSRPHNLVSLIGWSILLVLLVTFSRAPRKIIWRPVIGGFLLQFFMAALVLKLEFGFRLFKIIGDLFKKFMDYSEYGSSFVFGSTSEHFFAFKVLPVIIFFSTVITILYYLGVMQVVIEKIAMFMKFTVGTTGAESLCAAGNIFVGCTEAPIMIRPFLAEMTNSELHAVMVSGFATIAGGVMAAYIMNGVPAAYLITASVMNAPASLAVSKVIYPELGRSRIGKIKTMMNEQQQYNNLLHAAASGASAGISLVANIAANLIAFVSLLYIANGVVSWFGAFVCLPDLTFELICGYILQPLVFTMGVQWQDAGHIAQLIGIKTFINEFVAYNKLSDMMKTRSLCGHGDVISARSEIIATFALCGFANFGCIGVQLGGLGPMAPSRLVDMTKLAVSAMFGGLITNLMSACLAGLLIGELSNEISCNVTTSAATVMANLTTSAATVMANVTLSL